MIINPLNLIGCLFHYTLPLFGYFRNAYFAFVYYSISLNTKEIGNTLQNHFLNSKQKQSKHF